MNRRISHHNFFVFRRQSFIMSRVGLNMMIAWFYYCMDSLIAFSDGAIKFRRFRNIIVWLPWTWKALTILISHRCVTNTNQIRFARNWRTFSMLWSLRESPSLVMILADSSGGFSLWNFRNTWENLSLSLRRILISTGSLQKPLWQRETGLKWFKWVTKDCLNSGRLYLLHNSSVSHFLSTFAFFAA